MTIILIGASGSGKSLIEKILAEEYDYEKIVSYTTRKIRENEVNGVDYHFTNNETFKDMVDADLFAEYDEYSQGRLYGTLKTDYVDGNKIVVLTPNGLRKIKQNYKSNNIFTVLIDTNLGTRVKRYIDRCGVDKFSFDDKNEIASRVDRDFGAFLGIENEVDLVIHNNEGTDINSLVRLILSEVNSKCVGI